jgi:hypothetical protein
MSRSQCPLRYGRCSCDLCSRCSMWIPCISTQRSALRRTEVSTLSKIPGFTLISWQAFSTRLLSHWSVLNTPKSIGVPMAKNPYDQGSVQASWLGLHLYPLATESLVQVLSDNAENMRWRPIMPLMKRHMLQGYWHTAPVSLLCKTTGPKAQATPKEACLSPGGWVVA